MHVRRLFRLRVVWIGLIGLVAFPGAGLAEPVLPHLDDFPNLPLYHAVAIPSPDLEVLPRPVGGLEPEEPLGDFPEELAEDPWAEAFAEAFQPEPAAPDLPPYPVEINQAVERHLERYQSDGLRPIVGRWLDRSSRFLEMMQEVFRKKGIPEELAFMAMVESGFSPVAVSRAGAKGLWQFMERTGRRYGLRVDRWVDERLDPEKSTLAAAEHLKDLHSMFGDWFLAQAAYNAGALRVARAVARSRSNDFWTIARSPWLREETKQFVPQIQAAMLIAREPERYGFQVTPEEPLAYEVVPVDFSASLERLALLAGLPPAALRELNTALRRGVTPPGKSYPLRVPPGSAPAVGDAIEQLRQEKARTPARVVARGARGGRAPAGVYIVRPGDTLSHIATRHRLPLNELARLNDLDLGAPIFPGDRIRVTPATASSQ
jgi:membrane-bound lytic murein transglycosylase D